MRRRYLWLLAVFVPTVLGLAALSYLIFAPNSQSEASTTSPIVRQAPQVEDTISDETVVAPADADVIESSAPRNDETPVTEPESTQQRPAHAESSDIIGPPMLASSTATDASDAPAPTRSRGSIRLANLSAAGGGGGAPGASSSSSKTSGDSTTAPPVDTSNSGSNSGGDSSTPGGSSNTGSSGTGGDTDPNGGKGGGAGDDSAAPNTPNPNPDHDEEDDEEDPPRSDDDPDNDPYPTDPFPHEGEHPPVQVPEPASFGLLLLGLAGCAVGRRRQK
jgi:hypothetical protein